MSFLKDQRKKEILDKCKMRLTKQSHKDECDINVIVARYKKTGQFPLNLSNPGVYGDFSGIGQYQDALEVVLRANEQFDRLPAELRKRFGQDVEKYLAYVADPANVAEMQQLGMIDKKVEAPKVGEPVVKSTNS